MDLRLRYLETKLAYAEKKVQKEWQLEGDSLVDWSVTRGDVFCPPEEQEEEERQPLFLERKKAKSKKSVEEDYYEQSKGPLPQLYEWNYYRLRRQHLYDRKRNPPRSKTLKRKGREEHYYGDTVGRHPVG